MSNPKATIIIANHNYGAYISDAIKSAVKQTYQDLHVIIVDDGSTDKSWDIINKELFRDNCESKHFPNGLVTKHTELGPRKYSAIKLAQSNGPSFARNVAIDATITNTDYYIILDADDVAAPTKVEKFVKKLSESPQIGVVYADYDNWNIHTGNIIREYKEPYNRQRLLQECIVHSGAGINKEALLKVKDEFGYYDCNLRCGEDWDLWLRISDYYTISHIPECLTLVRVHSNNATYSVNKDTWNACWNRIQQKTKMRLSQR